MGGGDKKTRSLNKIPGGHGSVMEKVVCIQKIRSKVAGIEKELLSA